MFTNDEDYMRSLKRDDSYHFTIPFEYIKKNYGNDNYDIGTMDMEIDVQWNDSMTGYLITHYVSDMSLIDPSEGNSDEAEFYETAVESIVLDKLESLGISAEALVGGTGTW